MAIDWTDYDTKERKMSTGKRIEGLREDAGLKQKQLALDLNVSPATISHYESDTHQPDGENLARIADYFQVSVDYLLGRIESRLSPDVLDKPLYREASTLTVGAFLKGFEALSPEHKKYLLATFQLLRSCEDLERKAMQPGLLHETGKTQK